MDTVRPPNTRHPRKQGGTQNLGLFFPVAFPQKTCYPHVVITQEVP